MTTTVEEALVPLLDVSNLSVTLHTPKLSVKPVDRVSYTLGLGERCSR